MEAIIYYTMSLDIRMHSDMCKKNIRIEERPYNGLKYTNKHENQTF